MKILHLIYDHPQNPWVGGGGAVRANEIYRRLSERHHITMVSGKFPGAADYEEGNITARFQGTGRNNYILSTFCYVAAAAGFLRREAAGFDLVIEDFAPYNPLFSFFWVKDPIIQVHQKEGLRHLKKYAVLGIPFYLIESFYPLLFRNFITISEMSRRKFGLKGRGIVVSNGFDARLLSLKSEDGDFVLFLGRLHINQKGLDVLSGALEKSPFNLYIAGGGKDEAKVRKSFGDFIDSGTVKMTGYVTGTTKEELLRRCKFLITPSRYEGQPLSLIEAAACGKPVIVSDIPELRYAVDAGFGLPFKGGDAKDLAEKVRLLLENDSLRDAMGKKAREFSRGYTWDKSAERFEEFLLGVRRAI